MVSLRIARGSRAAREGRRQGTAARQGGDGAIREPKGVSAGLSAGGLGRGTRLMSSHMAPIISRHGGLWSSNG